MKRRFPLSRILICLVALAVPVLLFFNTIQARRYAKLKQQVESLEKKQGELVEENRKLITDISILSSSDRIENLAENELGMHKAEKNEIVRVEIKGKK